MISKQQTKSSVKKLLKNYALKPSRKFGQNFLIDKSVVNKVIKAGELKKSDIVLEIGPGTGILTREIAKRVHPVKPSTSRGILPKAELFNRVKKVIAVEKDSKMCQILRETLKGFDNIEIIQEDILKIKSQTPMTNDQSNPKSQFLKDYKIIANLPFYLTAVVIRKFLEIENKPKEMILIIQKEVAQRICSKPPQMSLLAVAVQFYAEPKIIDYISKKSFWPEPEVDAAIIKIVSRKFRVPISRQFRERFFRILRAGFSHPRKTILNNLSRACLELAEGVKLSKAEVQQWLLKNNIQPYQRAESLSLNDWLNLTKTLNRLFNC